MKEKSYSRKIIEEVEIRLIERYGVKDGDSIAAAVSGGLDSICLLHILVSLASKHGYRIAAVHVNHGIRGKEADRDEGFVRKIAQNYRIAFLGYSVDSLRIAYEEKLSVEEAARNLRYSCFDRAVKELCADKLAIAHHADDSVETFLLNLARGSGLKGLSGIPGMRNKIIRPLLAFRREELKEYAQKNGLDYVEDLTNSENTYTRNRIRNIVIPCLSENINARATDHIQSVIEDVEVLCSVLDELAGELKKKLLFSSDTGYLAIDRKGLSAHPFAFASYLVSIFMDEAGFPKKDITRLHYKAIYELAGSDTGKRLSLPSGIEVRNEYEKLIVALQKDEAKKRTDPIRVDLASLSLGDLKTFDFDTYHICVERLKYQKGSEPMDKNSELFDISSLSNLLPLSIRYKEKDDYMVIDEDNNKKKLSRIFIDHKLPRAKRDEIPILAQGNKVICIPGLRRSRDTWVSENTEEVLKIYII